MAAAPPRRLGTRGWHNSNVPGCSRPPGRSGEPADFATPSVDDEVASALGDGAAATRHPNPRTSGIRRPGPLDDTVLASNVYPVRRLTDTKVDHSRRPASRRFCVPAMHVRNDRDRPIPPEMQDAMIDRLPRAPNGVRLGEEHLPSVTEPERFAAMLESVLETL
jgi:pimeloyl-ACP methyl ester carboxylesterase